MATLDFKVSRKHKFLYSIKDESVGFTVISKEKDFTISQYPLLQTDFLYDSILGTPDNNLLVVCWLGSNLTKNTARETVSKMDLKSIERL